jgi:hypothetical protein
MTGNDLCVRFAEIVARVLPRGHYQAPARRPYDEARSGWAPEKLRRSVVCAAYFTFAKDKITYVFNGC